MIIQTDTLMRRRTLLRASIVASITLVSGCNELTSREGNTTNVDSGEGGGTQMKNTPPSSNDSSLTPVTDSGMTAVDSKSPFEIDSVENCTVSNWPRPTPVAEYSPQEYPEFPDHLTVSSVEIFAEQYEEAYRFNSYLGTDGNSETEQLLVDSEVREGLTEQVSDGYLVGVEGDLSVAQEDIVEDNPFAGVYYVSPSIALRGDLRDSDFYDISSLRSISVENQQVIHCGINNGK